MREAQIQSCLAALETAEHALVEDGNLACAARVSMAIDCFRATHRLPPRPIEPALLWLIEEEV